MKKVILSVFLLLGLVGCKSYTSPGQTIQTAGKALQSGDFETYAASFSEDVRDRFTQPDAIDFVAAKMAGYQKFKNSRSMVVSRTTDENGHDTQRTYVTSVFGKKGKDFIQIFSVTTTCEVSGDFERLPPNGGGNPRDSTPGGFFWVEKQDCRISDIN